MGGTTDPALARLWAQRKSVFDLTQRRNRASEGPRRRGRRDKLDAHLTAMRDVETRLVGMTAPGTMPAARPCTSRRRTGNVDLKDDDQYLQAGQMQMDMAAAALACDQTRILTFQWSYSESEHLFQFLNNIRATTTPSPTTSRRAATNYDAYNTIQTWYAQQFAYFLGKLDSYKEGTAPCSTTASCSGRRRSASRRSTIWR